MAGTGKDWKSIIEAAAKQTDVELASQISSLSRLTDAEIAKIAPERPDKERLVQLLTIVADATKSNTEKAVAVRNTAGFAELAVSVIKTLA